MIDFDPNTQIALMPQDVAMKFMTWASYYNGLDLTPGKSFADASLKRAKELGEPCPFPEESLNALFGKPLK